MESINSSVLSVTHNPVISYDDSTEKECEAKYLRTLAAQKRLQKDNSADKSNSARELARLQVKLQKYAKKYGVQLILKIINEPHIVRSYAIGPKYALEFITQTGSITIYSHPQNQSVKPKLEVYSAKYGFIAWWHEKEFEDTICAKVWKALCLTYKFDPADASIVERQRKYEEALM